MKRLFNEYRQLITAIEQRTEYINTLMKAPHTQPELASLRRRKETLKEEYDELIMALHDMAKYYDDRKRPSIRREVNR